MNARRKKALAAALAGLLAATLAYVLTPGSAASAAPPTAAQIVGSWKVAANGAPYVPHLFQFDGSGTMLTTNPTNVQVGTTDSVGMGAWRFSDRSRCRGIEGTFVQLNADDNRQPAPTLTVDFCLTELTGNTVRGTWRIAPDAYGTLVGTRIVVNPYVPQPTTPGPTPTATVNPTPSSTPSSTPTVSPTVNPTLNPTPTPTTPATTWPGEADTGVPPMTVLTPYSGPCTITVAGTVLNAKTINCDELRIRALNVVITNSVVPSGRVNRDENDSTPASFTISDTTIRTPTGYTGLGSADFVADRVEITGGNRSAYCYARCTIRDSLAHKQIVPAGSDQHASGIRLDHDGQLIHNTIKCEASNNGSGGGCSAAITQYPDWGAVRNNLIRDNYIESGTGATFCSYGGNTAGKRGSDLPSNATEIRFIGNRYALGNNGKCASAGPITDWNPNKSGNVWIDNAYVNGVVIPNVAS